MGKDEFDLSGAFDFLADRLAKQARHPDMTGYQPHDKQKAFHSSEDYLRLYLGGNRAGKTHGGVIEDLWWATGTHPYIETPPPPVRIRVVVTDFILGLGQVMLPKYKALVRPQDLKGGSWDRAFNKQERLLTFKNGSEIQFMSYEQDLQKFAGTSQHAIHFDEEPPKEIYNECAARVIDTAGRMWVTMTPVDGITWIYEDIFDPVREAEDKEIIIPQEEHIAPVYRSAEQETTIIEVGTEENPFVDPVARERFFKTLGDEEREARSKGQFVAVGGKVFSEFDKNTHVIPPISRPADFFRGWEIHTSCDFGWNNPTAWLWHAVAPNGTIITFWEHYQSRMNVAEHATFIKDIERALKIEVAMRVGDPAGHQVTGQSGTSYIMEYATRGLYISTEGIPREPTIGIEKMHQYFQLRGRVVTGEGKVLDPGKPTWFITENCVNTIREIRNLQFDKFDSAKTRFKNNKRETVQKKNDHAFDAMKYFATQRPDLSPDEEVMSQMRANLAARGVILPYTGDTLRYDEALARNSQTEREGSGIGWTVLETFS